MKVRLLHRDREFEAEAAAPPNASALAEDLELETLWRAMARDDEFVFEVARKGLFAGLANDVDTVLYRQAVLADCLKNPEVVREIYALAVETIAARKRHWFGIFSKYPGSILYGSIELMQMLADHLARLRRIAETHAGGFRSEGFTQFFAMLSRELSDDYLAGVRRHLTELRFRHGTLLSAALGDRAEGRDYALRRPPGSRPGWLARVLGKTPPGYSFRLPPRDEAGARILSEMRDRGINRVANALAQSVDHVMGFIETLRRELAFYAGCLNLHECLAAKGEPLVFPRPVAAGARRRRFRGLYDPCLSLHLEGRAVGNAADADGRDLIVITGPNRGGKSSFLRALGLAQLMMQAGMYVAAESFDAQLCTGLFTHYKREEDATLTRGKFDEELARLSDMVPHLRPDALVLFNESFAATNEREGSEIAAQIVRALLERRIKVCFVTHLYTFAHHFFESRRAGTLSLLAERLPDGTRTFKLHEGEPSETSYGEDVYRQIFGAPVPEPRHDAARRPPAPRTAERGQ
jgi:MutS domain V